MRDMEGKKYGKRSKAQKKGVYFAAAKEFEAKMLYYFVLNPWILFYCSYRVINGPAIFPKMSTRRVASVVRTFVQPPGKLQELFLTSASSILPQTNLPKPT